jgi:CTP:molybdopterin cytidylyltransferase MocA
MLGLDAVGGEISERLFHRAELVRALLQDSQGISPARLTPRGAAALLTSPAGGAKAQPAAARLLPLLNKADGPLRLLYGRLAAAHLAHGGQAALLTSVGAANAEPVRERWGQIATVILAAGASTRLGRPKQVEPVAGIPMLLRALRVAASQSGPVYVVTGAHRDLVMALLDSLPIDLAALLGGRLHVIHNPRWAHGQATSLHASVRGLPPTVEAAIWLPVDQPFLDGGLLARLAGAWRAGADLAAPLAGGTLRGAPALFDRSRWPDLLAVTGDRGGRAVLQRNMAAVAAIPVAAAMLRDIDSPHDLAG